jgi:pilus assembly protein FimV
LPRKPLSAQGKQRKLLFSKTEASHHGQLGVVMSLRYVVRLLLLAGLAPSAAWALGLGEIHLNSPLNAPLQADIDLSATADEIDGLKVGLASRDTFTRYGLDYPAFLAGITLEAGKDAGGRNVIHVRSRDPITEPFATLLVEANWPRGRLVREYTVLLDPPAFTGASGNPSAVATPETSAPARAGTVQRPDAAPAPQAATPPAGSAAPAPPARPAQAPVAAPAASATPGDYTVHRGETLSAIVAHHYNNGQRERALVATFKANAAAFAGNMNVMKAGATLHLPDADAVAAIGPAEASSEVLAQYRAWTPAKPGGQLKLVAPSPPPAPPAPVVGKPAPAPAKPAEPAAGLAKPAPLPGKVQPGKAEAGKAEAARLLELKNAELARLQALQAQAPKPAPAATAPPAKAPAATAPPAVAPAAVAPAATVEPPPAAPPAEVKKPLPKPVVAPAEPSGGLLDLLIDNWLYLAAAVVLVIAGLFGMKLARNRQSRRMERTFENFTSPPPEPMSRAVRSTESTTPIKALKAKDDQGFVVEESGTHEILALDQDAMGELVPSESAVPIDSTVSLEQGDPLAEADFHMAYGLYDQAADLVRLGIAREPDRHDLKLKLLEVYFVWGNKDQFLQLARELTANRAATPAGEWEKVLIMGRQIAPDDPLFSTKDKVTGAASGGVDLNLEGGQNHVDFDLLGEPTLAPESKAGGVDLDLGAALGADHEPTGESPTIGDTGVDFILDDPQRGADGTGITREMPNQVATLDFSGDLAHDLGLPGDAPTVEQPHMAGQDNATLRTKLDASARALLVGAEQTTELALDDLGLDLSADSTGLHTLAPLDATGESMTSTFDAQVNSAPTQLTNLSEDTRTLLARASEPPASSQIGMTQEMPALNGGTSGTWLITDQDFSEIMKPEAASPGGDGSAPTQVIAGPVGGIGDTSMVLGLTGEIESLRAGAKDVDHDLEGLDAVASTGNSPVLDLDLGSATAQMESRFSDTQRLDAIAIPPPANTVEPATMSEVGTKLDLARAYMDMGDPEGARSILEEVLSEGSASQKTEARRLIESLPG